jgi:hypothetical protein
MAKGSLRCNWGPDLELGRLSQTIQVGPIQSCCIERGDGEEGIQSVRETWPAIAGFEDGAMRCRTQKLLEVEKYPLIATKENKDLSQINPKNWVLSTPRVIKKTDPPLDL